VLANPDVGGSQSAASEAYTLVAAAPTSRVTSDNTVQDVVQVTARSDLYDVTFTWFVEPVNWNGEARTAIIGPKTAEVNEVCGHPHVIAFRTQQDQDASRLLVNYAIISVGTDDGAIQDDVKVRMDRLNAGATFGAIDAMWTQLVAAGAV
jgi:hypothetical protein